MTRAMDVKEPGQVQPDERGEASLAAQRWCAQVTFDDRGLVPVIAQDVDSGEVLMVAWTDLLGLQRTLLTGEGTYFSRSRNQQWIKGETSGHYQRVIAVHLDCDRDAVLYRVKQEGPACHTGARSCFDAERWDL